jgi:hypothetical protein
VARNGKKDQEDKYVEIIGKKLVYGRKERRR